MLLIHRAERADALAEVLAELLADTPPDPFAGELVAVPTRGIERWLTQRLSAQLGAAPGARDGVCANVAFPSPGSVMAEVLARAGGVDPEADPWRPERLVWTLIDVVERALDEDWLDPLARHLRADRGQRYARLAHLARLFSEYGLRRPELIQAWARGETGAGGPGGAGGAGGRAGAEVEHPASRWQAELWCRARELLAVPSPAERLDEACATLERDPEVAGLPPRLALFGLTRLPAGHLRVLRALATRRDVHLMLLHPSPAMWSGTGARNRLLASWGRDVQGLQRLLLGENSASDGAAAVAGQRGDAVAVVGQRGDAVAVVGQRDSGRPGALAIGADLHHPAADRGPRGTLLATLQSDIHTDRTPPGRPLQDGESDLRLLLDATDHSIQVHACHGRARQVEVLREALLHRLQEDPTLEPRDVIVMCPDIEAFAPLIEGVFGAEAAGEPDEPPALRARLADRSLRRTTPMLATVARLLELASSRVSASEVLDLADTAPVRARFAFDDDELAQVRAWVAAAHIHWGLDAAGRAAFKLTEVEAGTWADGFRRLLLGVAMDPGAHIPFAGVLASSAVLSSEIELAGRLREFVDRLDAGLRSLAGPHTLPVWAATLAGAADSLTATAPKDAWQRQQLDAILAALVEQATAGGRHEAPRISLTELRALMEDRLAGRPTRANFRSGHLTFCTLVPMRSVPHRLVCLLGLDDGSFPRPAPRDGDNLLLADPRPGDRDPRTEDRQLLLDALLAAQEALIITYSGNDERTNATLPPAVPVGELLDAIDASARVADGEPGTALRARDRVVVRHPLQPFDPRNFAVEADARASAAASTPRPWSFDAAGLAGARALSAPRNAPPAFLPEPLPPALDDHVVPLTELVDFIQRPVRAFLRQRLEVSTRTDEDEIDDALPIELDGLARWGVGERLLAAVRRGVDPNEAYRAEIARGALPPGALGAPVIRSILPTAAALAQVAQTHAGERRPRSEQTNVTLNDGSRLTGTVGGIHGHVVLQVSFSRLGPRQRLAAWVRLLALSAAHPRQRFEAVTIGCGAGRSPVRVSHLAAPDGSPQSRRATALEHLGTLASLRAEGLRAPLALPCATAHAYAEAALRSGEDPVAAAMRHWRSQWSGDRFSSGEEAEPEHRLALGSELDLSRLAELAIAVWRPLFAHESMDEG